MSAGCRRSKVSAVLLLVLAVLQFDACKAQVQRGFRPPDIIVLEFTQSVYNASEGGGDVEVCLETDMELPEAVQVTILASEILSTDRFNRAIAGDDFIPAIFEVTLPESMCVQITTLPDSLALEIGEVFQVSFAIAGLTNDDGSLTTSDGRAMVVPGIQVATVVIIDEDVVTVEFTDAEYSADEGEGRVGVCLFLDVPIATPLTVYVEANETTPTSATDLLDFTSAVVPVIFPATDEANSSNVSCGYFSIVEDKLAFEGDELFTVSILPHATAVVGGNNTADVIILDNDVVSLTYEIAGRPEGVRPITGETVTFTCEVEGNTLTWQSLDPIIDNGGFAIIRTFPIGMDSVDSTSGGIYTLVSTANGHLVSTFSFPDIDPALLNNTVLGCEDNQLRQNNDTFYMAGVSSPPLIPRQSGMTCTCVNVTWDTPIYDGAAPLTSISITSTSTSNASLMETVATDSMRLEICGLVPNLIYNASIVALNRVGSSTEVLFEIGSRVAVPSPPLDLSVESVCEDSTCNEGHVQVTWKTPSDNLDLLCEVLETVINYTIIELGIPDNATSMTLPPETTNFTINPLMPGTSYIVQVSYRSEAGESQDNPTEQEDVLLFTSFLILKVSAPDTVLEGGQAVYNVRLNGPPPSRIAMEARNLDILTRVFGTPLQFNTSNWFQDQNVVIMAVDDDVIMESPYGAVVSMESISSLQDFEKQNNLTLTITEGDTAEVIFVRKEVYPDPTVIPEGRWVVYLVTLPNRPYYPVTITFVTSSPVITSAPFQISIEPELWNVPHELTVIAVEDEVSMEGGVYPASFQLQLESEDGNYNGKELPDLDVTVEDNDEDSAVVSGTLTWMASPESARIAATLYLTLTLRLSQYPNATSPGATIPIPGVLAFGDGSVADSANLLTVQSVDTATGYVLAAAAVLHTYPHAHNYGNTWSAVFEYCCRDRSLQNNRETTITISADVDLTQSSSPLLPTLSDVTFHRSEETQQFFLSAQHPESHPLLYSFGTTKDYGSSQSGTPQGLQISYSTGHVTWNTSHVVPGSYSVQVVVVDAFTNIRVTAELLFIVMSPTVSNAPPSILTPTPLLPHDVTYTSPDKPISINLTLSDTPTILGIGLSPADPLPDGVQVVGPVMREPTMAEAHIQWQPTSEQLGTHILCFVATDNTQAKSLPTCLVVIVTDGFEEQPLVSLEYPGEEVFQQSFTRGIDQSVLIASEGSSLSSSSSSSSDLEHMYIRLINTADGAAERLVLDPAFSHPSLSYQEMTFAPSKAQVVYFEGVASADVYLSALRSISYTNTKASPSIGERLVVVTAFDGVSSNPISISFSTVSVSIDNTRPRVTVSGGTQSYTNRYFPFKGPVSAIESTEARVIDTDSLAIQSAVLQLRNVRNFQHESLAVTYVSPDRLSLPVIGEALALDIPFGNLSTRQQLVPAITSTITIPPSSEGSGTGGGSGGSGDVQGSGGSGNVSVDMESSGDVEDMLGGMVTMETVGTVKVIVDIRHSWVGDLQLELEHDGRRETLVTSPGGQVCPRDDLFRTVFDSEASSGVFLSKTTTSPGLCRFQAQGVFTPDRGDLGNFRGDSIEGEWSLHITDHLLGNDNGRLVSWAIIIQPEESHTLVSYPPVVPPLSVSSSRGHDQRHVKEVSADGRIREISLHVQLGVSSLATMLYLPTMTLVHPDGSSVLLTDSSLPLCAVGNFSYIIFNDRSQARTYSCAEVLLLSEEEEEAGSMSSGSRLELDMGSSSSGSGSAGSLPTYDDLLNMNVSIPMKHTLADLLTPVNPLSTLQGKTAAGKWTLVLSGSHQLDSTLLGWSMHMSREPNIDPLYNSTTSTLTLSGADSAENYEEVIRSVVYDNMAERPDFSIMRVVETTVSDGELYSNVTLSSSESYITIHHIDIDLDPRDESAADAPGYAVTFREHSGPIPVLDSENALLRDDAFSEGQYTLTARLRGYRNVDSEGLSWNISAMPNLLNSTSMDELGEEFVVTISSQRGNLRPIAEFEAALRSFEYFNTGEEFIGSTREVQLSVLDVQMDSVFVSDTAVTSISLIPTNDIPILVLNSHLYAESDQFSSEVEFTEGQGAVILANSSAIILTDNDHDYIISVSVTIENPQDAGSEVLSALTTGTGIDSSYDNYTLTLYGNETLQVYISVLGSVSYDNTIHSPGLPGTEPRRISFVPFDGTHFGLPAIARVTFAAVNDPPMGDLNGIEVGTGTSAMFVEEDRPLPLLSVNAYFFDADNSSLAFVQVQLLNPLDAPLEVLSVMDVVETSDPEEKVVTVTNLRPITSYDTGTGRLRVSGLDSILEYERVLRTLTYVNLADEPNPDTRMLELVLNDGLLDSETLNITIFIELVNDSPFFITDSIPVQHEIDEDVLLPDNGGITVAMITEQLASDDDVDAVPGLVVTGIDSSNGTWEYTADGMVWNEVHTNISRGYGLALEADADNAIRFVPNQDFNGIVTFTVVAWDGTDGSESGNYIIAESSSNIDAFSSGTRTISVVVTPVNDAPELLSMPLELATLQEDDRNSIGGSVLSLLTFASDVDIHEQLGIAVIGAEQENGVWQFTNNGGEMWEEFEETNDTSALLLWSLPEDERHVRFVPNPDYNGQATFQFLAWDLTVLEETTQTSGMGSGMFLGSASGSGSGSEGSSPSLISNSTDSDPIPYYPSGTRYMNTTLSDAFTGPFSVNSTSVVVTIDPVNDSPVILAGMSLRSIMEDTASNMNHGTRVSSIIAGFYMDVDVDSYMGVAVVGVDNRFGEWQYTCGTPGSSDWLPFIAGRFDDIILPRLTPEMATLLLSTCWIRFVPDAHFNTELDTLDYPRDVGDAPFIMAHGWDNTGSTAGRSGEYGVDVSSAATSDTNEFSSNAERISIQVTSENDKPELFLTNATVRPFHGEYVEDLLPVPAVGPDLVLLDYDHEMLRDVAIVITGSSFDVSPFEGMDFSESFSNDFSSGNGSSSSSSSSSGSGSGAGFGSGMDDVTTTPVYVPVISSVPPSLTPLHLVEAYVRNLSNSASYEQRYCAGLEARREELLVDTQMLDLQSEVLSYCPYVLHIFPDPTISPEAHRNMFQVALRSLHYNNSLEEPEGGDRTLTFVASDNVDLSSPVNSTIFIRNTNDAPQLLLNTPSVYSFVSFTEGQGPLVLANASALRLIDHDNRYLQSARVVLLDAPDSDREVLDATAVSGDIEVSYDNATFVLTLTGNATVADYASTLATVTYDNLYATPGNPNERERQVEFTVSDGGMISAVATAFVSFVGVNDRPYIDLNGNTPGVGYNQTFVEELGPVPIAPDVLVHDEDNSTLAYIVVKITNPFSTESLMVDSIELREVLERNMYGVDKIVQITSLVPNMTYDTLTGSLIVRGLDTVGEFRLVLATIMYDNTADEPGMVCKDIEFIANDWELNSTAVYTQVCTEPENDSPRNNASVLSVFSPLILEDEEDAVGVAVAFFAYDLFQDPDVPRPQRGIAVVSVDSDNGNWQYRIDGQADWIPIPASTDIDNSTVLLSAEPSREDFIRFLPSRDFHGNASISFVGWDGSDGCPSGTKRSARSRGRTDPFSEDVRTMVLRVVPVNDPPTLGLIVETQMTAILEDAVRERESLGDEVSRFLELPIGDVDIDDVSTHEFGIAVVGTDSDDGFWQFSVDSGGNWSNITSPSPSNSLVLTSRPPGYNRIRFIPNRDFNGESSFQYKLWDRNVTWPSGTEGIDTNTDPDSTFSSTIATARLTIDPVNDSPIVVAPAMLSIIPEDFAETVNSGTSVDIILRGVFGDLDGPDVGVAVLYADKRNGDWQYTCMTGSQRTWLTFVGQELNFDSMFGQVSQLGPVDPNEFRATLLDDSCFIRFLPDPLFNTEYRLDGSRRPLTDTPFIAVRGWDGTSGSNMEVGVDTTSNPDDHTNAFSLEIINVSVAIASVNNPPVLNLDGMNVNYRTTFVEPIPPSRNVLPVPMVNMEDFSLVDVDNASLSSAAVSFVMHDAGHESLTVDVTDTTLNYTINIDTIASRYSLLLTPADGISAPIGHFRMAIGTIHYLNSAEEPDITPRQLLFTFGDGLDFTVPLPRTEVLIQQVNDPPQLDLAGTTPWPNSRSVVMYTEGQGSVELVSDNATLEDFDDRVMQSASVVILSPPDEGSEILNTTSSHPNITITLTSQGSELVLAGEAGTAEYLDILRSVTYTHLLSNPSTLGRTIQFTVSDGQNNSIPSFVFLSFGATNNPPMLDLNGNGTGRDYTSMFREEGSPVVIVSGDTRLEDIDNSTLAYVAATILNPLDGDSEVLYVEDVTVTSAPLDRKHVTFWNYRPTQYYDSDTATLTITGLDTVYEYQQVLKTLQYNNVADEPQPATRVVEFEVSDGLLVTSGVFAHVEITNINDPPFFNTSAPLFAPSLSEDVGDFENPGWSVEELVASRLILDDDAGAEQGIAITGMDFENGIWEVTWDFTTDEDEFVDMSSSGMDISGSGTDMSGSGMDMSGSGTDMADNETESGGRQNSGSGMENIDFESGSGLSGSGSGSGFDSGSGSGIDEPTSETKCPPTTPTMQPPMIVQTFYANWRQLSNSTSIAMATVLSAAGNRTRVRFVPNRDFEGVATVTFKAWDVTDGLMDGDIADTSSNEIDLYSTGSVTITVTMEPVNDAPLLSSLTFNLTDITEDDVDSFGDAVSDLIGGISDVDAADSAFGVAVVLADEENGEWQFSTNGGSDWTTMSQVCPGNATVLNSDPNGQNRVRLRPFLDFNGHASISLVAWDLTSGEPSGMTGVDTTAHYPVTGPFSVMMTSASIRVEPENDSPVLFQGARLADIYEDIPVADNNGTRVADIVGGRIYLDVDVGSQIGIAVTGVDPRNGTWEWICPESDAWNEFYGDIIYTVRVPFYPRPEKATLLDAECRIRFLPNLHFNTLRDTDGALRPAEDLPYIEMLGWDHTGLTAGFLGTFGVDTTYNNDSTTNEFSAEVVRAVLHVASINDLTVVRITAAGDGRSFETQFTEEQGYTRIVEPDEVFISDSDHASLDSILVVVSNSLDPGMEVLSLRTLPGDEDIEIDQSSMVAMVTTSSVTEQIQIIMNIFSEQSPRASSLRLTTPPGMPRASVQAYQALLALVVYNNLNPEPNNTTRLIQFYVDDLEQSNTMVTTTIEILLLNDNSPVLTNSLTSVEFVEGDLFPVLVASDNLTLIDLDHNDYFFITNATIQLTPIPVSPDESVSVDTSFLMLEEGGNFTQYYDPLTGRLTITGEARVDIYEDLLRTTEYENNIEEPLPGTRMVTMQVHDGNNPSNIQRVAVGVVLVNDRPPEVTVATSAFVFTERSSPVAIGENVTLSDPDSGGFDLESVTIVITNAIDGDSELLNVTAYGDVVYVLEFDGGQNTLVLEGPASISDFLQTLSTLTYTNVAEEPDHVTRRITVEANDGDFNSTVQTILVEISLVNDLPVIFFPPRDMVVNYVEGDGPVSISSNITLSDNDHTHFTRAMVTIRNPLDAPDEVLNLTTPTGIDSAYNRTSGTLTLWGNATVTDYQLALRTLTYENEMADPGFPNTNARSIVFSVFDSSHYSEEVVVTLTFDSVNDAPRLDLNGPGDAGTDFSVSFVEEGEEVYVVSRDAILFDVDNTSLSFLNVTILNRLDGDEEVLALDIPDATMSTADELLFMDLPFASFTDEGSLFIAGLDSLEDYLTALTSITYINLADEPSYTTRTLVVVASDGLLESDSYFTTIDIIQVNDPPRLFIAGEEREIPTMEPSTTTEPQTTSEPPTSDVSGSGMGSGDMDNGSGMGSSLGVESGMQSGSGIQPSSGLGSGMQSGSGIDLGSGMDPSTTEPPATTSTTGAAPETTPTTDSSSMFENVTLGGTGQYSTFYAENSLPVPVTSVVGVLVEDDDDRTLVELEVVLHGVMDAGFETIFFDTDSLSRSLVAAIFLANPGNGGYLGDDTTCVPGSGAMTFEEIDLRLNLTLQEWEEVVRSIRYCSLDHNPVPGTRRVSFRIQDPSGAWSETQNATVEVFAINDAPICETPVAMFTIDEDTPLTVVVLGGCFDHEETLDGSSIVIHTQPRLGSALLDPTSGEITFLPSQDDYGLRSFAFQACDTEGSCSTPQTITVLINPVNDPPYSIGELVLLVGEDSPTTVPLTIYFGDVEDDLIEGNSYPRVNSIRGNTGGGFRLEDDVNSTLTYTPFVDFIGRDSIILEVCDSVGVCVDITLIVLVSSVNDPPTVLVLYPEGASAFDTTEDTLVSMPVEVRDIEDVSFIALTVVSVRNGTAEPNTSQLVTRRGGVRDEFVQTLAIDYTPDRDFFGEDVVVIEATDSDGNSTQATIRVRVAYVNDPPMFGITDITIQEDAVTSWTLPSELRISDPENALNAGSFAIVEQPSLGNLSYEFDEAAFLATGVYPAISVLTYTPPPHFFTRENEPVTFTLQACDSDVITTPLCANGTFRLTILSVNDAPVLRRLDFELYEDTPLRVNLWELTSDVEEGRPPMENITLSEPLPSRGVATYDPATGYLDYVPFLNEYGMDLVAYNACDSQNRCSSERGEIGLTLLEVNDPPVGLNFTHVAREDDFDLIGFFSNITDNETTNLRIEIVNGQGAYVDLWTTDIGGQLRVYRAHQIITYLPPPDYVGGDTFRYSVCDTCDPRREAELGRVGVDPQCQRQVEENGGNITDVGGVYITCSEATVEIVVANINDIPVIGDLSGVTEAGLPFVFTPFENAFVQTDSQLAEFESIGEYLYRNSSSTVYEPDDQQVYSAAISGLNFTLYNLNTDTDIDESSLRLLSDPASGAVLVTQDGGRNRLTYIPRDQFSGYDSFRYEVCDKARDGDDMDNDRARCSEGVANIWVTSPGPALETVTAKGAMESDVFTDSRVGTGDIFSITFTEATNMPPHGNTDAILSANEVNAIFTFNPPFFLSEVSANPYTGTWVDPTEFQIKIVDEGYPVPFQTETTTSGESTVTKLSSIKVGEWRVSVNQDRGPCGGFGADGRRLTDVDPYCLLNADGSSLQAESTSQVLEGNYGLRLPNISNIVIRNVAVDDSTLVDNLDSKIIFEKSQLAILLQPTLSYDQLALYCEKEAEDILNIQTLAESADVIIVGCANLLSNGENADAIYSENIEIMQQAFLIDDDNGRRRRDASAEGVTRARRQAFGDPTAASYPLPVASEVVLQLNSITNPRTDPAEDLLGFVSLVQKSFNAATVADVIFESLGVLITDLTEYSTDIPLTLDTSFYYEFDDDLTPQIVRVVAGDPDNVDTEYSSGDTVTIFFDRSTDQPDVATKSALDRIFVFTPSLGRDYVGTWVSPSVLEISVVDAGDPTTMKPSVNPVNFNLTFLPNYFHTGDIVTSNNTVLPTETPWCVGVSVCGPTTISGGQVQTVGICNDNRLSCRAYQGWTDLAGNFGTGVLVAPSVFPWWWIVIGIVAVLLIVIAVVVIYFLYRYYSQKAVRKEALRVIRRWNKDKFSPGKEAELIKKEEPKPWVKPQDVSTMRQNPDPFDGSLRKLPTVHGGPRPPTAMTEAEHLPPVPEHPFRPRALPQIGRPSLTSLPGLQTSPRRSVAGSLSPLLDLPQLVQSPTRTSAAPLALPPLKGGAVAFQAGRALGDVPEIGGTTSLPGAMLPRRLPSLSPPTAGLGVAPDLPQSKGKGPSNGRKTVKKSPHASSEEDVSGAEGSGSGSALSPPFAVTRPLAPLGPTGALPAIGRGSLPTTLNLRDLPAPLGPRRVSTDPFGAAPLSPIHSTVPLSPIRLSPRPGVQSPRDKT